MPYTHYVALGDSMSLDLYPALDVGATAVAVNLERKEGAGEVEPLGAASLLLRNDDARWPGFAGEDLATRAPGIVHRNLCEDGAAITDVFAMQLEPLAEATGDEPGATVLVTLTVGGTDLLHALMSRPSAPVLAAKVRDIGQGYLALVDAILATVPGARLLLTTVCDPSDGTGRPAGISDAVNQLPIEQVHAFNALVREIAARRPNVRVADAHAHFLGHGVTAPEEERWFWRRSLIEPSARGASELRRLWLELVD